VNFIGGVDPFDYLLARKKNQSYNRLYGLGISCMMRAGQEERADSLAIILEASGRFTKVDTQVPIHEEIQDSLVRYLIEDQGLRRMSFELNEELVVAGFGHLMEDVENLPKLIYHKRHISSLEKIIDSIGFPSRQSVGYYGMKSVK